MFFPTAGIEVAPWLPPMVAFGISFFTSMGGVSGAFLLLPFQVSVLGYANPSVSATNQLFNIVAIPSGVYRYIREGRMVWPLTWVVIIGTLPGVLIGAIVRIRYLPDPRSFKLFAGLVLLYIGARLLRDLLQKTQNNKGAAEEEFQRLVRQYRQENKARQESGRRELPRVAVREFSLARIVYEFYGQTFEVPTLGIMGLSLIVGVVGGIYGIGGGAIIAPFFVSFFGLPVYTVAGAALMGTFVTSVAGVAFYQFLAPFYPDMVIAPDWGLGLLFGLGGFVGMYCGARLQKFVPPRVIKWILTFCILFPAVKYIWGFFR
ncbi:MAG: sulfite exporter TauE/SafE family protein [Desulfurivibrionaceae bacterium]